MSVNPAAPVLHSTRPATRRPPGRAFLAGAAVAAAAACAAGQSLVDPSFESFPLDSYSTVLNNFPVYQGVWGAESAVITGAVGPVLPPDGVRMLAMFDDSLAITQAVQITDVSANPFIAGGGATFSLDAQFNVENVAAAQASVIMQFYSGPGLGSEIPGSQLTQTMILDTNPMQWETITLTGSIPAATTWMVSQVGYWNATMSGEPGYVDLAGFSIIPTPGSLALLGAAGLITARRRR